MTLATGVSAARRRMPEDADFAIGPSYLMKPGVYRDGGLERTWRTKILSLLEEHHYGEGLGSRPASWCK
ncbi:hypothetical protein [Streptomyces sp. JNUCC 63]